MWGQHLRIVKVRCLSLYRVGRPTHQGCILLYSISIHTTEMSGNNEFELDKARIDFLWTNKETQVACFGVEGPRDGLARGIRKYLKQRVQGRSWKILHAVGRWRGEFYPRRHR